MLKILLFVFVAWVGWSIYRFVRRVGQVQDVMRRAMERAAMGPAPGGHPPARDHDPAAELDVEDMVECRVCGNFIPAKGARHCERRDCPW